MRRARNPLPPVPARMLQTYQILSPAKTHFRAATCEEAGCLNYINGWKTVVPTGSDHVETARRSGRRHVETRMPEGLTEFVFEAGQPCFQAHTHRVPVGRPELFVVRRGRGAGDRSGPRRQFTGRTAGEEWVEHSAGHLESLRRAAEWG